MCSKSMIWAQGGGYGFGVVGIKVCAREYMGSRRWWQGLCSKKLCSGMLGSNSTK
jgi:hypothetical protein